MTEDSPSLKPSLAMRNFIQHVLTFVVEYGRSRVIGGVPRMGHAESILDATRIHQGFARSLPRAYAALSPAERMDEQIAQAFWQAFDLAARDNWPDADRALVGNLFAKAMRLAKSIPTPTPSCAKISSELPCMPEQRYYGRHNAFDAYTYCG